MANSGGACGGFLSVRERAEMGTQCKRCSPELKFRVVMGSLHTDKPIVVLGRRGGPLAFWSSGGISVGEKGDPKAYSSEDKAIEVMRTSLLSDSNSFTWHPTCP